MDAILTIPERHPGRTVLAVCVLISVAYGTALVVLAKPDNRIVVGDALDHYVQLRSAVFDRDLHFQNDYTRLYGLEDSPEAQALWVYKSTPTGHIRNYMPVGPALVWAPLFLLTSAVVWLVRLIGAEYPLDGFAPLFQAVPGFSGIIAAGLGSWFAYLTAARLVGSRAAIWATITLWLGSSALYYSLVSPTYSHAASMLTMGIFWLVWSSTLDQQNVRRYAWVGFLAGLAALMRWQDALILVVPAIDATWHRNAGWPGVMARTAASFLAALLAFTPQMLVWQALYGTPLTIPQGSTFMRWGDAALWAVLLSDNHGLLTWTPVLALALFGFVSLVRRVPNIGIPALAFFAVSWYINAAVADWWAGEAFGARRFVSCFPVFVLGFAALLARLNASCRLAAAIAAMFVVQNGLLLFQYQLYMHGLHQVAPYPRGFEDLWLARYRVPYDFVVWWLAR